MQSNQNHQRIAAAFDRLFRTYGPLGQGDTPEEVTRDRIERIKVYFEAVAIYDERDVEAAIEAFLTGAAPGISNRSFAPPAPVVGGEVRRQMNLRVDRENRERALRPALPPPDIERSPESQQRVRDMVAGAVAGLTSNTLEEDPIERHRRAIAKANAYFDAERGFSVGDPDGAADAA